jgi:helicase SWR1
VSTQETNQRTPVPTSTLKVKRVKLVVRRPPPPITNPRQRPPPPKHNSSLREFLSSYVTYYGQDVGASTLQQHVATDAALFERIDLFRRQGRFIPGTDALFGFNVDTQSPFATPLRTAKDLWDNVIEAVIRRSEAKSKVPSGREIAAQVASKVRAYWDAQEAKKDKVRVQEERRLRTLAKATIKIVTNEWKKAVFVSFLFSQYNHCFDCWCLVAYSRTRKAEA